VDVSGNDLDNVTRTIMAEAGENATPASMAVVASVIRNRLAAGGYGKSPSEIVHAPGKQPSVTYHRLPQSEIAARYRLAGICVI
jgi:spore germination cell wall hydrolase CwlJ-like protein